MSQNEQEFHARKPGTSSEVRCFDVDLVQTIPCPARWQSHRVVASENRAGGGEWAAGSVGSGLYILMRA